MQEFKSQKIKTAIKELLKKKDITYENLAEQMECSVPTIKRILGPEELTLNRLLQLCEIVEIDLAELELLTVDEKPRDERFTPEQEAFLAKNPNYFAYLMKLFGGDTPKQIADKYNLTQRSTDKYLIALEKQELIRVTGKQKVKPAFKEIPNLGKGILGEASFGSFIQKVADFFILTGKRGYKKSFVEDDGQKISVRFGTTASTITRASYEAFIDQQEKAFRDFNKLCDFESKTKDKSELMVAVITQANTLVKSDDKNLEIISSSFGEVTNI